jgi:hypothetical protein
VNNRLTASAPEPEAAAHLTPVLLENLRLSGIGAFGKRRAASLNGRTLFQGEEAELSVNGVSMKLRCLEVKEASAIIQILGRPGAIEVKMPPSNR